MMRESGYRGWLILFIACVMCVPCIAGASRPVERRLTGCVVKGQFFSVSLDREKKPARAYRIRVKDAPDLSSYEGKGIEWNGWLLPGDMFIPAGKEPDITGNTCPEEYRKVIGEAAGSE